MVVIMCNFKQLVKYQVKDMNVYIDPFINEILKWWVDITMHDLCKSIRDKEFQLCGILVWAIHDAVGLTHFCGM